MRYLMNDYELIYLIQNERDDIAMSFMFKKYHKFIWKQVHLLNVDPKEHDTVVLQQTGTMGNFCFYLRLRAKVNGSTT